MNDFFNETDNEKLAKLLLEDVSQHIKTLISIVFGDNVPERYLEKLRAEETNNIQLEMMKKMALVEFHAGLQKALNEESELNNPINVKEFRPFGVYTIVPNLINGNIDLAVCMPIKKHIRKIMRLPDDEDKAWIDKNKNIWKLGHLEGYKLVTSLSSTCRILDALETVISNPSDLSIYAMERSNLLNANTYSYTLKEDNDMVKFNESQRLAILSAQYLNDGFFVIQGPPGCGKTTTIVEMILKAYSNVIVLAPSNAAVANIAIKLFDARNFDHSDIFVYGDNCDESVYFLNPSYRSLAFRKFSKKYQDIVRPDDPESENKIKNDLKSSFSKWLKLNADLSLNEIDVICPYINDGKEGQKIIKDKLESARVILCTLNTAGSAFLQKYSGYRNTLFLDEAAQCTEAEFYIATTYPNIHKMVLVGDPKQLPATVIDEECKNRGYGKSWMENVMAQQPSKVHLLNTQYRMHPHILNFPNQRFYSGKIKTGKTVLERPSIIEKPFQIINTRGGREEKEKHSWRNSFEVANIKALLHGDDDIKRIQNYYANARIVIITPYRGQVELLQSALQKIKDINLSISTVDSFQGQEAEIVIISTVRTKRVGFIDDNNRLNVALTRAKCLVRVFGDIHFFKSLLSNSTLRALVQYSESNKLCNDTKIQLHKTCRPNWSIQTLWKLTMKQRLYDCMKTFPETEKNICFNTLYVIAMPLIDQLYMPPTRRCNPCWQISSLRGNRNQLNVVWVAKKSNILEAHFCGARKECLRFTQSNRVPLDACHVKNDLAGVDLDTKIENSPDCHGNNEPSWILDNNIQNAISSSMIEQLPEGFFFLDEEQRFITESAPPLLIESRSGTGKTNVLFQHALKNNAHSGVDIRPICFVTVSSLLSRKLHEQYNYLHLYLGENSLPKCVFFSLNYFIDRLSEYVTLEKTTQNACKFIEYVRSRSSHTHLKVDLTLIENEIGGVIMGSLDCALKKDILSREEYLNNIRSNISKKDQEGINDRNEVYDEFEKYQKWKFVHNRFDIHDIILELISNGLGSDSKHQLFSSVYLDEVQDFSYAFIYLICSIAGKQDQRWIFAGDTAQMISPGCSFKFSGLKQTLLAVRCGIEASLKDVKHLLRNYRTTKNILDVANGVLEKLKKYFPNAIEYTLPERAVNNNSDLKVILCNWSAAFDVKPAFSQKQAFIYSSFIDSDGLFRKAKVWLMEHPFVLSAIESKGLEFEDIVVAIEAERSVWKLELKKSVSLRLLRELYVAITRARRRVVILVKNSCDEMVNFFYSLGCNVETLDATSSFVDFDCESSLEEWFQQGSHMFELERYQLASQCFRKANSRSWSIRSLGYYYLSIKNEKEAIPQIRNAARLFYNDKDFKLTLDSIKELSSLNAWDNSDTDIYEKSLKQEPIFLSRDEIVKIDISRNKWQEISLKEMTNLTVKNYVERKRYDNELYKKLRTLAREDLDFLAQYFPSIIGDIHFEMNRYNDALLLFILNNDYDIAISTTQKFIDTYKFGKDKAMVLHVVDLWRDYDLRQKSSMEKNNIVYVLLSLFKDPVGADPWRSMKELGKEIVRFAVEHTERDHTLLHKFDQNEFHPIVLQRLKKVFHNDIFNIVEWFVEHNDRRHALSVTYEELKNLSRENLSKIIKNEWIYCWKTSTEKNQANEIADKALKEELYVEASTLFLKLSQLKSAIHVSELSLTKYTPTKTYANDILMLWKNKKMDKVPNLLFNLLILGKSPHDRKLLPEKERKDCVKRYGIGFVKDCVLRWASLNEKRVPGSMLDIMKSFDSNAEKSIVSYCLWFIDNEKINLANTLAEQYLNRLSKKELLFIYNRGLRPEGLRKILEEKKLCVPAIALAFEFHDDERAYILSTKFLTRNLAIEIYELWEKNKKIGLIEWIEQPTADLVTHNKNLALLFKLFIDPDELSLKRGLRVFGDIIIKEAVLRKSLIDTNIDAGNLLIPLHIINFEIITWYYDRKEIRMAKTYTERCVDSLDISELLEVKDLFQSDVKGLGVEFIKRMRYSEAAEVLSCTTNESETERALQVLDSYVHIHDYRDVCGLLLSINAEKYHDSIRAKSDLWFLLKMFYNPLEASQLYAKDLLRRFGLEIIQYVLEMKQSNDIDLPSLGEKFQHVAKFKSTQQKIDILGLKERFSTAPYRIVEWLIHECGKEYALRFIFEELNTWSAKDFSKIIASENIFTLENDYEKEQARRFAEKALESEFYVEAAKVFMSLADIARAADATENALAKFNKNETCVDDKDETCVDEILKMWSKQKDLCILKTNLLFKLLKFTRSPQDLSKNEAKDCVKRYGKHVVKEYVLRWAVTTEKGMQKDVLKVMKRFDSNMEKHLFSYFQWFVDNEHTVYATIFALNNIQNFSDKDILQLKDSQFRPKGILGVLEARKLYLPAIRLAFDVSTIEKVTTLIDLYLTIKISSVFDDYSEFFYILLSVGAERYLNKIRTKSKFWFALKLLHNPLESLRLHSKECIDTFGQSPMTDIFRAIGKVKYDDNIIEDRFKHFLRFQKTLRLIVLMKS